MRLNNAYQGHAYKWALMMDGEMAELFCSQVQAIRRMAIYRRKHKTSVFAVVTVKGLFDGK